MKQVLLVFVGGGLGSVLRYLVGKFTSPMQWVFVSIPTTIIANLLGSLIIGFVLGLSAKGYLSNDQTLLLAAGFCGGFTTFSAFSYENLQLLKQGDILSFTLYAAGSLVLGILAVLLGLFLSKAI